MSGIILPGQEKKPQPSGGGLEIAGGFGKKRDDRKSAESTPQAPAAPTAEPAQAPAQPPAGQVPQPAAPPASPSPSPAAARPAAAPAGARRPTAEDFLFPPAPAQIQCPSCGTPFVVPIFTIIDLAHNPELKSPLLSGQINVAQCPKCGMGGPLTAPLMVHEPSHQFLAVYVPAEGKMNDMQRQKVIGDLSQTLMRKLPTESRKGYMLQPKQYMDWQRFSEKLWEFEGVTPEMLRRQRNQSELLQSLLGLSNDRKAVELTLQRSGELVDRSFFAMLDRVLVMADAQGQSAPFVQLRNLLLEVTETGRQIKEQSDKVRAILSSIKPDVTREQLLQTLIEARQAPDGQEVARALIGSIGHILDYQFLLLLNERIDHTSDEAAKQPLEEMRDLIVALHEQIRQTQQAATQQMQQLLNEILSAEDMDAALRQYADYIDENFLAALANSIHTAEQRGSKAAAGRLKEVYERALSMIEEAMPPEMRLINQLLNAEDRSETAKLLNENRALFTPEFIESLKRLEGEMRNNQRGEVADKLKSLRGQISLKM